MPYIHFDCLYVSVLSWNHDDQLYLSVFVFHKQFKQAAGMWGHLDSSFGLVYFTITMLILYYRKCSVELNTNPIPEVGNFSILLF